MELVKRQVSDLIWVNVSGCVNSRVTNAIYDQGNIQVTDRVYDLTKGQVSNLVRDRAWLYVNIQAMNNEIG